MSAPLQVVALGAFVLFVGGAVVAAGTSAYRRGRGGGTDWSGGSDGGSSDGGGGGCGGSGGCGGGGCGGGGS